MIAGRHPASVATAFTAPINATATPACPANTRVGRSGVSGLGSPGTPNARMTGSNTQGASIIGSVSDEMEPRVVSTRGDRANAAAPISRAVGVPIRSASATRSRPQNPAVSNTAHHSR